MITIAPLESNLARYLSQFAPAWAEVQRRIVGPHCKMPPIPYKVVQEKVIQT